MFRRELAAQIVRGEKTATRRAFNIQKPRSPWWPNSKSYPVGKIFTVNPGRGVPRVAECEVTGRRTEPLGAMSVAAARREGFQSLAAFYKTWEEINGGFDPRDEVHVVEFKLVGTECPACRGTGKHPWGGQLRRCFDCYGTGVIVTVPAVALLADLKREAEHA